MLLDNLILFVGKFAVLVEYRSRNAYLTYVMQESCVIDLFAVLFILACELGDLSGILGDSGRVTLGVRVLGIDGILPCAHARR